MKKLLAVLLLSNMLYAEAFESFLESAITNSPYLKASKVQIEQTQAAGSLLKRYENPMLDLEVSYFDQQNKNDLGYRVAYAQPVRLWGVGNDKETLADANVNVARANYAQMRAAFIRDISLQYTQYAQSDLLLKLAEDELLLAQNIYDISQARYEAGTVARGVLLQSKVDYKMVVSRVRSVEIVKIHNYYALLKYAGISEEVELDTTYTFAQNRQKRENPELLQLQNSQKSAIARAQVNTNKVEWMNLMAEYENEPDQDIFRFGASIPLAFFNTKSQERQIATLEASKAEMLSNNAMNQLSIEHKRLSREADALAQLQIIDLEILENEKELLSMFEEGYKIANINLLALQDAKARLIETKERLIKIKIELDRNAITQNYLQGNYND